MTTSYTFQPVVNRTAQIRDELVRQLGVDASLITETDLESIVSMSFGRYTRISDLRDGDFHGLSQLDSLTIFWSRMLDLGSANTFEGLDSLTRLDMRYNAFEFVHEDIFQSLGDTLIYLNMCEGDVSDGGGLSTLHVDTFAGLTNLETLNLSSNSLSELAPTIFRDLGNLKVLHMQQNLFTSLDADIFNGMQLTYLRLDRNPNLSLSAGALDDNLDTLNNISMPKGVATVSIGSEVESFHEGEQYKATVTLSHSLPVDLLIPYVVLMPGGFAVDPGEFTISGDFVVSQEFSDGQIVGQLKIDAGQTEADIVFSFSVDGITEGDESFEFHLGNGLIIKGTGGQEAANASLVNYMATVSSTENHVDFSVADAPEISVSFDSLATSYTAAEDGSATALFTITLDKAPVYDIVIPIRIDGINGATESDYRVDGLTYNGMTGFYDWAVSAAGGGLSHSFTITAEDDTDADDGEELTVSIEVPSHDGIVRTGTTSAQVNIINDDPQKLTITGGGSSDDTIVLGSEILTDADGREGNDRYVLLEQQTGSVRIDDDEGVNVLELGKGVKLSGITESSGNIFLQLADGGTVEIVSGVARGYRFKVGNTEYSFAEFKAEVEAVTVTLGNEFIVTGILDWSGWTPETSDVTYSTNGWDVSAAWNTPTDGEDVFIFYFDDDSISVDAGGGADRYHITRMQTGDVTISDILDGTADTVYLDAGTVITDITYDISTDVLTIKLMTGNTLAVEQASENTYRIAGLDQEEFQVEELQTRLSELIEEYGKYTVGGSDDDITGDGAVNHLFGAATSDTLVGGGGDDMLTGGGGADIFVYHFDSTGGLLNPGTGLMMELPHFWNNGVDGQDTILDFSVADGDRLHLIDETSDANLVDATAMRDMFSLSPHFIRVDPSGDNDVITIAFSRNGEHSLSLTMEERIHRVDGPQGLYNESNGVFNSFDDFLTAIGGIDDVTGMASVEDVLLFG